MTIVETLSRELGVRVGRVQAVVDLLDGGSTIPFIARYRKEATGGMDDVTLRKLGERLVSLRNLQARKSEVIAAIDAQGKLTGELQQAVSLASTLQRVEDLYKPFKKKRVTRAAKARDAGLEPLANLILAQPGDNRDALDIARGYINVDAGYATDQLALAGAMDIVAERVAEDPDRMDDMRTFALKTSDISVTAINPEEKCVYDQYYDFSEPVRRIPNHRVLAINRGEKEGYLRVRVRIDQDAAIKRLDDRMPRRRGAFAHALDQALVDGYKRLMAPSIERDIRSELTERAQADAIRVFASNTKSLLMQRPLRGARVISIDPGFRTGCKVAVLDEYGKLLDYTTVYPTAPRSDEQGTFDVLDKLVEKNAVNTIAIGNGTASRETEEVIARYIKKRKADLRYTIVNEAGASVYSASRLASEEYPDLDVVTRGAMSLGRRLQDPLSELVKIPPESIGVGQYQHDLNQAKLKEALRVVVEDAVNSVGVNLNTASASLLGYVSGISGTVAKNIVAYREERGPFTNRSQLKKVPKLGPKTFQNCAGFLRIDEGSNPLDATNVHPESYEVAKQMLARYGLTPASISSGGVSDISQRIEDFARVSRELECGEPTLRDIVSELEKPGRDPRDDAPEVIFSQQVTSFDDLCSGMELVGTVRNVVDFGAFVDIGVKQDGLVHVSEMADRYVGHPSEVVSVGDNVNVRIINVDKDRGKISLSMKSLGAR